MFNQHQNTSSEKMCDNLYNVSNNMNNIYIGHFKQNVANGKGQFLSSKFYYQGMFKNGNFDGKGKILYSSGDIYKGEFKQGIPYGKGIYKFTNGSIFYGVIHNRQLKQGKLITQNGIIMKGQFKNNKLAKGIIQNQHILCKGIFSDKGITKGTAYILNNFEKINIEKIINKNNIQCTKYNLTNEIVLYSKECDQFQIIKNGLIYTFLLHQIQEQIQNCYNYCYTMQNNKTNQQLKLQYYAFSKKERINREIQNIDLDTFELDNSDDTVIYKIITNDQNNNSQQQKFYEQNNFTKLIFADGKVIIYDQNSIRQ